MRGMGDILPADIGYWQKFEAVAREVLGAYGYDELRVPVVEHTELFKRSIGEFTDIVEKEMYTFVDKGGESLTLRPEATAGVVRAAHLQRPDAQSEAGACGAWAPCSATSDRRRAAIRQFHQLNVETFGYPGPDIDAELILDERAAVEAARHFARDGCKINSLGTPEARRALARSAGGAISRRMQAELDDGQRRGSAAIRCASWTARTPSMRGVIEGRPADYRASGCGIAASTWTGLCAELEPRRGGISASIRGWCAVSITIRARFSSGSPTRSGSQDAVCSGGRYDGLIAQLGGEPTPAVGLRHGHGARGRAAAGRLAVMSRSLAARMSTSSPAASVPPGRARAGRKPAR